MQRVPGPCWGERVSPTWCSAGTAETCAGGCGAGSSVATARTPGAIPLDAGPGQTVLAFGTQMVLVAEVVVALACGIALPLPLGRTGGRPDGGRRLPDRAGRGGHAGDGGRERAAFCGHLRGEGGSDAQKAEDAQQAERLAIHDGTSWSGQKGRENSHLEGWPVSGHPAFEKKAGNHRTRRHDHGLSPITKKRPSPAGDAAACPSPYPPAPNGGFGGGRGCGGGSPFLPRASDRRRPARAVPVATKEATGIDSREKGPSPTDIFFVRPC